MYVFLYILLSVLMACNQASAAMVKFIVGYLDYNGEPEHFSCTHMIKWAERNRIVEKMEEWSGRKYVARFATDNPNYILAWNKEPAWSRVQGLAILNDMKKIIDEHGGFEHTRANGAS